MCSSRGVCDDGKRGAGTCACNAPFYGDACELGACPHGQGYIVDTDGLYHCQDCEASTFSSTAGNNACEVCPDGTWSSIGATQCVCTDGYLLDVDSDSLTSSTCIKCTKGEYFASASASDLSNMGCTVSEACNFDSSAIVAVNEDCAYAEPRKNCDGTCISDTDGCSELGVSGCTDSSACNYAVLATYNDGSYRG